MGKVVVIDDCGFAHFFDGEKSRMSQSVRVEIQRVRFLGQSIHIMVYRVNR